MPATVRLRIPDVNRSVRVLRNTTNRVAKREGRELANLYAVRVQNAIYAQSLNHVPLNPAYRRWKQRVGLDDRILIATGEYVDSISWFVDRRIRGVTGEEFVTYRVGLPNRRHSSGIDLGFLMRILEHGTRTGIPARPHFAPIWRQFRADLGSERIRIQSKLSRALRSDLG